MRIYSIFNSIDGEVNKFGQGCFTTFIRFAGCNLRCSYCDTKYALESSSGCEMSLLEVINRVEQIGCNKVTITGGEPLFQWDACFNVLEELTIRGHLLSLETNGTYSNLSSLFDICGSIVVDYKIYGPRMDIEEEKSIYRPLRSCDFIKFVVENEDMFYDAVMMVGVFKRMDCKAKIAFSPVYGKQFENKLIELLKKEKLFDCMVNFQLHKYVGLTEEK